MVYLIVRDDKGNSHWHKIHSSGPSDVESQIKSQQTDTVGSKQAE